MNTEKEDSAWRENEFGELQRRITKAEARQALLRNSAYFLVDKASFEALREIQAIEDASAFGLLERTSECPL